MGDSRASGGKLLNIEPFGWLDSCSTETGTGSGAWTVASTTDSLGVFDRP